MSTPTATQKALHLQDIILIIFEQILSSVTNPFVPPLERSTLAAAARVCGAWKVPALKTLWRNLDTLSPLFELLPTIGLDLGDDSEDDDSDSDEMPDRDLDLAFILMEEVSQEDWGRFTQYAAYVRVLDLCNEARHEIPIDPMIYGYLSRRMNDGKPLLPSLRDISWFQKAPGDWGAVYLIPPTLRRLRIQTKYGAGSRCRQLHVSNGELERRMYKKPRRRDHELCYILREILPMTRNLEHLTLDGFHHLPMLEPITGCLSLETLELESSLANPEIDISLLINILAKVKTLRRLTITVEQAWDFSGNIHQPMKFQFESLESLHLSTRIGEGTQSPAFMFASVDCQRLRHLSILIDHEFEDIADTMECSDFLRVLRLPTGFAQVHTLQVQFMCYPDWSSAPPLLSDVLLPLATLHRLQQLYLVFESEAPFTCTDEDIRLITRYWPKITTFAATFCSQDGKPTVRALNHIIEGWPQLEVLCLPSLADLADFDKIVHPRPCLRRIGISASVVPNCKGRIEMANFAVYLALLFPNLMTEWPLPIRLGDVDHLWGVCHTWEAILELVGQARANIASRGYSTPLLLEK